MSVWADSPLLLSNNPNLPVGANDMAFDRGQHYLYIDNAGNRQMFRIPVEPDGSAGPLQLFADGATIDSQLGLAGAVALYGADGIQFDVRGNLYVMANQADEVQVLSPAGELIAQSSRQAAFVFIRSEAITAAGRNESSCACTRIPSALRSSNPSPGLKPPTERSRIHSSFVSG